MPKCSFCGNPLKEGRGKMFVKISGQILYFCASKCERNLKLGRDPKRFKWTTVFRKGTSGKKKEK